MPYMDQPPKKSAKERGTEEFKLENFKKAIELYTTAMIEDPEDHTIFGNRSAAHYSLKDYEKAIEDAETCILLKDDWAKGYQRKGQA